MNPLAEEFRRQVDLYENTAAQNDQVFAEFAAPTAADPLLAMHRRYGEENQRGFGDPAFHSMWRVLLAAAQDRFGNVEALEIGVSKARWSPCGPCWRKPTAGRSARRPLPRDLY